MPTHGSEIPYEKRVAIVCLRLTCGFTYSTIADKLNLKIRSVHQVYSRALERTEESLRGSFVDVAKNVRDAPQSGRPATGRSKKKPRASRNGLSRPAKPSGKRPEDPGNPVEEQRPLISNHPKECRGTMVGLAGSEAVNQKIYGEPVLPNGASLPQPHGSEVKLVWSAPYSMN